MIRVRRRSFTLLALSTLAIACGDLSSVNNGIPITYHLVSVNDSSLPALVDRTRDAFGSVTYFMTHSTIELSGDSTFEHSYSVLPTRGTGPTLNFRATLTSGIPSTDRGVWILRDSVLFLRYADGSVDSGIVISSICDTLIFKGRMSDGTPLRYSYVKSKAAISPRC
jgi:hypothetical protein